MKNVDLQGLQHRTSTGVAAEKEHAGSAPLYGPMALLNCTRNPRLTCCCPLSSVQHTRNCSTRSGSTKRACTSHCHSLHLLMGWHMYLQATGGLMLWSGCLIKATVMQLLVSNCA